jgi:hypothetical protein
MRAVIEALRRVIGRFLGPILVGGAMILAVAAVMLIHGLY